MRTPRAPYTPDELAEIETRKNNAIADGWKLSDELLQEMAEFATNLRIYAAVLWELHQETNDERLLPFLKEAERLLTVNG